MSAPIPHSPAAAPAAPPPEVIVVGAGMAGLACARALADHGVAVRVLDKGRGIGGRMATRRVALPGPDRQTELRFDHGAQYVTARDPGFAAVLDGAAAAGAAAVWDRTGPRPRFTGLPGMSGLARHLAAGVEVVQGAAVTGLRRTRAGWALHLGATVMTAPRVVLAIPAPQAAALLGAADVAPGGQAGGQAGRLLEALAGVRMAPCLTLMAAFPAGGAPDADLRDAGSPDTGPRATSPLGARFLVDADHPLAWIARDSSKPGRTGSGPDAGAGTGTDAGGVSGWVAQAGPAWSARHLDEAPDAIAARMLPLLAARLGLAPGAARHVAAHRWRYARVETPLGAPFLADAASGLWLAGDWCLGARVEAAWHSGRAVAAAVAAAGTAAGTVVRGRGRGKQ